MKLQMMNNQQYFLTLPNKVCKLLGWEKGDTIELELGDRGKLVLKKTITSESL